MYVTLRGENFIKGLWDRKKGKQKEDNGRHYQTCIILFWQSKKENKLNEPMNQKKKKINMF